MRTCSKSGKISYQSQQDPEHVLGSLWGCIFSSKIKKNYNNHKIEANMTFNASTVVKVEALRHNREPSRLGKISG